MTKKWWASKGVWLGVCTFLLGAIPVIQEVIEKGDLSAVALMTASIGILKVFERVMRSPASTITM